ncbi:hypothetical protein GE09DRAFT_1209109 [Coniochaeta sp. 2T2.1]|nr:hypothetical protein GE09DRAFT_1209109 [Coniochaeta sp. 2T2.1]
MSGILDQLYPPKPSFTEKELPDQTGKVHVFLITGGASGLGFELAKILYQKNGTVYIATRSLEKIERALKALREAFPDSKGRLEYIIIDLADLTTARPAAEEFLRKEAGTVRIWLASMVAVGTPKGGVVFDDWGKPKLLGWAGQLGGKGVVSVVVNPGMVKTELQRQSIIMSAMMGLLMKPARYGAYTQLFAALSPEVTLQHNGAFIIPWGRFGVLPDHIEQEIRPDSGKEARISRQFWGYCEGAVNGFWGICAGVYVHA